METDDGSSDWMGIDLLHEGEDGWAGQCGGDGDDEEEKILIYYTRDFSTRGSLYGSFGVLCPRGWYRFIERKTPHIYIN